MAFQHFRDCLFAASTRSMGGFVLSCATRRFRVRRYISVAFVRRSECVPHACRAQSNRVHPRAGDPSPSILVLVSEGLVAVRVLAHAGDDVDAQCQHRDVEYECQEAVNQGEAPHAPRGHGYVGPLGGPC